MSCVICWGIQEEDQIQTTPCGHSFHSKCLEQWTNKQPTCPMCRASLHSHPNKTNLELASEINTLSSYHICVHKQVESCQLLNAQLWNIRECLRRYNEIRNKGYSDDHLATDIGYMIKNLKYIYS